MLRAEWCLPIQGCKTVYRVRRAGGSNPRPSRKICCNCSKFWEFDPSFAHILPTFFKIFSEGWCLTGPHDPRERPGLTWWPHPPSRPQTSPRKCQESSLRRRALTSVEYLSRLPLRRWQDLQLYAEGRAG